MRCILCILLVCFLGTAAFAELSARQIEQVRLITAQQLLQNPDNRPLRFRLAQASFQSGRAADAKFHLRALMRTARQDAELRRLEKAYGLVVKARPVSVGLTFSLLPSSNIAKTSSNEFFDTLLGQFIIRGGGREESGVGLRFGGQINYETVLASGASLTYGFEINRSLYPTERLNGFDGTVSVLWTKRSINGQTRIQPFLRRYIYDEKDEYNAASTRMGVRVSHEYYLGDRRSLTVEVTAELRHYDVLDYLDGPAFNTTLTYQRSLSKSTEMSLLFGVSSSLPEQEHLRYAAATLRGEVSRTFASLGTIGLNAGFDVRDYQGEFPALGKARSDQAASIGVSFRPAGVRVFNTSPKLSCQFQQNWSNVALYDYASTDCAIVFERRFWTPRLRSELTGSAASRAAFSGARVAPGSWLAAACLATHHLARPQKHLRRFGPSIISSIFGKQSLRQAQSAMARKALSASY